LCFVQEDHRLRQTNL